MFKSERLTVKVLPTDKTVVQQIAQAEGESVAAVVRRLIRQEARRQGLWPKEDRRRTREAHHV
jgi:hypothetical protein